MGWLFTLGQSRKELVERRTMPWQRTQPDGTVVTSTCLAHCYRGCVFSGVLWSVWERTWTKDNQNVQEPERWIGCDLLAYQSGYGWGFKDLDESCGPYYFSCPLGYLAMAPVANETWREGVRSFHARLKAKRASQLVKVPVSH